MASEDRGYQVEIYDLRTGRLEFSVQLFSEDAEGLEEARKERIFWERKCSLNWGVRIRRLSDDMVL